MVAPHCTAVTPPFSLTHTHTLTHFSSHVHTCGRASVQFSEEEALNSTRWRYASYVSIAVMLVSVRNAYQAESDETWCGCRWLSYICTKWEIGYWPWRRTHCEQPSSFLLISHNATDTNISQVGIWHSLNKFSMHRAKFKLTTWAICFTLKLFVSLNPMGSQYALAIILQNKKKGTLCPYFKHTLPRSISSPLRDSCLQSIDKNQAEAYTPS